MKNISDTKSETESETELSFSIDRLYLSSDVFKRCIEIFLSEFENIERTLLGTEEYWEGVSYESFAGVRDDLCAEIKELAEKFRTYDGKLKVIADAYKEAEDKNLEEVDRLPDNILE